MRRSGISLLGLCLLALTAVPRWSLRAQEPCGGVEPWAVKVAADPDANLIDVADPITTTLHELVVIPRPQLPPGNDETTRLAEERAVRIVDGRLLKFKLESGRDGDLDFHLVITDDTLQFSPSGTSSQPSPHSFVAEIINPDCVVGRNGQVTAASRFATDLTTVYHTFQEQFTTISGGWNDADGIPVRITGVGFFDRPHGQTGRALNGLEIHPVLDIEFNPTPDVTPVPTAVVIRNPGFESGPQDWTASQGVITSNTNEPARTGAFKAWLGGYGQTHTDSLAQQIALPGTGTTITLEFFLHISTEEQALEAFDQMRVRLRRPNGQILTTLRTFSNLQATPGFGRQAFNLTPFRGQTVRIELVATEDNGSMTSFVVDDFRIIVE